MYTIESWPFGSSWAVKPLARVSPSGKFRVEVEGVLVGAVVIDR